MTKRKRSILLAVLISVLCVAMAAAGTYALFTDDVGVRNHLVSGKMDVTLERTELEKWYIDSETGYFVNKGSKELVNFSGKTDRNIYDMTKDELIVPLSSYSAKMRITNNSDVAFHYWIEVVFDNSEDINLADQLYVTVKSVNGEIKGYLSELTTKIGSETSPISTVSTKAGENFEFFTVSVKFDDLDSKVNNSAMSQSVAFDIVVHAVQVTPETQPVPATPPAQP